MIFEDRRDAGQRLSRSLEKYKNDKVIVLAVPRGGLGVAYDTIRNFKFEWDFIITRKIGAPHNKEVAIGAVSSYESYILDEYHVNTLNVSQEYIRHEISEEVKEIGRRLREYRGTDSFPRVKDKTVIIIDDGIATGYTIIAAIKAVRQHGANKIILAIPVAPKDILEKLSELVDEIICLYTPEEFYAVGLHYKNFEQVTDEELFKLIDELSNFSKV